MANIPYKGLKRSELKKMMKTAKTVRSFAGPGYVAMHKAVIREIQIQKDQNAKATQKSMHMEINSGYEDPLKLRTEVQAVIDGFRNIAKEMEIPLSSGSKDIIKADATDLRDLCELAVSNIEIENQAEPKAEKILIRGSEAISRKLYNIRFNLKGIVSLLFDWVLLGELDVKKVPALIVTFVRSVGKLYDLALIRFDFIHAAILEEWYFTPKEDGRVKVTEIVETVVTKYSNKIPGLDSKKVLGAISDLTEFQCATEEDGMLTITESIVVQ